MTTLTGTFDTRRDADLTIERLVQEHGVDRDAIFIAADGEDNSVGTEAVGSDAEAGSPSPPERDDGALNGPVTVSVDIDGDELADKVKDAFVEFNSAGMVEN